MPSAVATAICPSAPGTAMRRTRQQVAEREVQPDAEHQEDDAELGELRGQPGVAHEARRERPDGDARDQVADDGRQAQPRSEQPEHEGDPEPRRDDGDQRRLVNHRVTIAGSPLAGGTLAARVAAAWPLRGSAEPACSVRGVVRRGASGLSCLPCAGPTWPPFRAERRWPALLLRRRGSTPEVTP